jgi:hypothetical protein
MSAYLYIDVELGLTSVTEEFFHALDAALATHHFLLASESPEPGERKAYRFWAKPDSPSGYIPWPHYGRRFDRDEVLHIRYECGPCPIMQRYAEQAGEPVAWGMTCWLVFVEPQIIKGLHLETGPEYRLLQDELGRSCFEHLKQVCDTLHERLRASDTALFRKNEDEGEKLPEPQRMLYRVGGATQPITV